MRITKLLLICICCLMAVPGAWGQSANSQAGPGILGYLDPHTGAFRPIPPPVDEAAAALAPAAPPVGGTLSLIITVTVKSAGINTVVCTAQLSADDIFTAGQRFFDESNSVTATGTGPTRMCKLSIPYSWSLVAQTTDNMTTSYAVVGSASATNALPNRTSGLNPFDTRKVPANGTTTTLTAAVTI